jgi:glycosyltransferase involved in cell wall biosynthesis
MLISVCMITYNHQDYIVEAIESVLKQSVSFPIEFIIAEDNSSDGTRAICENYARQYPDVVKLLPREANLGMMKNFLRAWRGCRGKYIAFMEGDDYWTDPLKLQKQIDFLESNKDYSACFHNVRMKLERDNEKRDWILHESLPKDSFDTEDMLGPWFIPSLSFVFVNYPDFVLPEWFFSCKYGDLPFMLLLSLRGKFKYFQEVMGVYRLHNNGASSKHKAYDKVILMIYIYENFNVHTSYKYQEAVRKACIYEIDKHIPQKDTLNSETGTARQGILVRGYRKVKLLIGSR